MKNIIIVSVFAITTLIGCGGADEKSNDVDVKNAIDLSAYGKIKYCEILDDNKKMVKVNGKGSVGCWYKTNDKDLLVLVSGIKNATNVSWTMTHGCAVIDDDEETPEVNEKGSMKCWGKNDFGQLGNGTTEDSPIMTAVLVLGIKEAVTLHVGRNHSCANFNVGKAYSKERIITELKCWGDGRYGQLGYQPDEVCGDFNTPCSKTPPTE